MIMNTAKKLLILFVAAMALQTLSACMTAGAAYSEAYMRARQQQNANSGGDLDLRSN